MVFDTVDIIEGINEEFNCNLTEAVADITYSATSTEKWVYIKYAGSADSYQVLCYEGNLISYRTKYETEVPITDPNGGGTTFTDYEDSITGYIKSEDYSEVDDSLAIQNFYYYKNYGTAFNYSQHISSLSVVMMGTQYNFTFLPVAFSGSNV